MKTFLKIALCLLLAAGFAACEKDEAPATEWDRASSLLSI